MPFLEVTWDVCAAAEVSGRRAHDFSARCATSFDERGGRRSPPDPAADRLLQPRVRLVKRLPDFAGSVLGSHATPVITLYFYEDTRTGTPLKCYCTTYDIVFVHNP